MYVHEESRHTGALLCLGTLSSECPILYMALLLHQAWQTTSR